MEFLESCHELALKNNRIYIGNSMKHQRKKADYMVKNAMYEGFGKTNKQYFADVSSSKMTRFSTLRHFEMLASDKY